MGDPKNEQRREERCVVRLPVDLMRGKQRVTLVTENVSFRGLFVRTERPSPERRLVQIEMLVPPMDRRVSLHATVVHVVLPGTVRTAGMGLQLMGQAGEQLERWEQFVRHVTPRPKRSRRGVPAADSASLTDPSRRRFERYKGELRLRVDDVDDLGAFVADSITAEGLLVATTFALPIGVGQKVEVIHPQTGETFALNCVVREHDRRGVDVTFERLDAARREAFLEFVRNDVPALSATVEYVDESVVDQWEEEEPTDVRPLPKS
jgi:hypothetical protein